MHRGECVTTGGLYRPTHLCVAHLNCTKKVHSFFFEGIVWRDSSPRNENSVINCSPLCHSKPAGPLFIFGTQIKVFLMKSKSFLSLQWQQRNYHVERDEQKFYRFGTTWRWVINAITFIFLGVELVSIAFLSHSWQKIKILLSCTHPHAIPNLCEILHLLWSILGSKNHCTPLTLIV